MKRKWPDKLQSLIALTVLTGLLLPSAAVFAAEKQPTLPNNASAIVARGEDAFMKSSYEFSANCIWNPTDNNQGNRWMIFRKDVELSEVPERVTAKIAADTKYWLYINGEMAVYEGQLKRGAALLKKDIYTKDNPAQPAPAPNAGKPAGLSAGAIAGIAIGAAVLLTAGAAAAVVIGKKKA